LVRKKLTALNFGPKDEAELLFLLGSHKHENLVRLLTAYSQDGVPNLIFERADMDLHQFMLLRERTAEFKDDRAVVKAIHGLSSGLKYIHSFDLRESYHVHTSVAGILGCHQDIKPRNILVRGQDFILADFGLMRLKAREQDSKTFWKDGTFEYGAPECRNPETLQQGRVGRASDIWSLGCIVSELMVYLRRGHDGLLTFRNARLMENTFGQTRCFHDNFGLNRCVLDYLSAMEDDAIGGIDIRPSSYLHVLIQVMLAASPEDRPDARAVEGRLSRITTQTLLKDLLLAIDACLGRSRENVVTNVFRVRLRMEEKRLRAWASLFELCSVYGSRRIAGAKGFMHFPQVWPVLELAIQDLKISSPFETAQVNDDFIVSRLHQTNDSIYSHLSEADKASADGIFAALITEDAETRALFSPSSSSLQRDLQYQDIGAIAAMKYMSILLANQSVTLEHDAKLEQSLIERHSPYHDDEECPETFWYRFGNRQADRDRILIEYKEYGLQWKKAPESKEFEEKGKEMFGRIEGLVAMLRKPKPTGFRVLDCLGCFHDTQGHRFGLVYKFPSNESNAVRLHRLLRKKTSSTKFSAHIGQRISLAKALVKSVHVLHIAGWVHKDINSRNILFFMTSFDYADVDLTQPFIVGFHHSRQDDERAYTEGPDEWKKYQHPNYQTSLTPFKKEYDYYSLGLVLLEIAAWEGLSNIHTKYTAETPFQLRKRYIKICDNQILERMGPTYHAATKKCLMADSQLNGDELDSAIDFQRDVVDELTSCHF
jgi:serine/threonine protein kinase